MRLLALLALMFLPACGERRAPPAQLPLLELDTPFEFAVNEAVRLTQDDAGELVFRFGAVTQDNRCPSGLNCVTAGTATAMVHVELARRTVATVALVIPGQVEVPYRQGDWGHHGVYSMRLLRLNPYPTVDGRTHPDAYRALLIVRRAVSKAGSAHPPGG